MIEEERIYPKNDQVNFDNAVARLSAATDISERNKQFILAYLRDSALGKTARGRAKKKIGPARRTCYINSLLMLARFVGKDYDQVTEPDMEAFIDALENGRIRSRRKRFNGQVRFDDGSPLGIRYVVDVKVNIRRFYRYLLGGGVSHPRLVDWFDVYAPPKRTHALTEEEVRRMVDLAKEVRHRALIQVLFDGGMRLGELMAHEHSAPTRHVASGHASSLLLLRRHSILQDIP